jgi:predicted restriction endonuclease
MFRLIKFLITGSWHEHEWEEIDSVTTDYFNSRKFRDGELPTRTKRTYVYQCKKCGIHRTKRVDLG